MIQEAEELCGDAVGRSAYFEIRKGAEAREKQS